MVAIMVQSRLVAGDWLMCSKQAGIVIYLLYAICCRVGSMGQEGEQSGGDARRVVALSQPRLAST